MGTSVLLEDTGNASWIAIVSSLSASTSFAPCIALVRLRFIPVPQEAVHRDDELTPRKARNKLIHSVPRNLGE